MNARVYGTRHVKRQSHLASAHSETMTIQSIEGGVSVRFVLSPSPPPPYEFLVKSARMHLVTRLVKVGVVYTFQTAGI